MEAPRNSKVKSQIQKRAQEVQSRLFDPVEFCIAARAVSSSSAARPSAVYSSSEVGTWGAKATAVNGSLRSARPESPSQRLARCFPAAAVGSSGQAAPLTI